MSCLRSVIPTGDRPQPCKEKAHEPHSVDYRLPAGRCVPRGGRNQAVRLTGEAGQGSWRGWVNDFSAGTVKALGAVEVLGAAGLILPAALDITPVLVPLAAVGLATIMSGAAIVMIRRHEFKHVLVNLTYLALAAFVAWGRFGPGSFTI